MKKLFPILTLCACWYSLNFAQGSWSQTTTAEFNTNTNFNVNTGNDEMKLTNDVGNGLDGDLYVPPGGTVKTDNVKTFVTGNNPSGQPAIQVSSSSGFQIGEEVLIISMQDNNPDLNNNIAGQYEFKRISNKTATALVFQDNLANTYNSIEKKHQVLKVPNYNNITLDIGGILTCDDWDGSIGGIICFRAKGILNILALAKIQASYKGFLGGACEITEGLGYQGESLFGAGERFTSYNMNGGGGGGYYWSPILGNKGAGGGGGSYAITGTRGQNNYNCNGGDSGLVAGNQFLIKLFFGGAGGSGGQPYDNSGNGKGGDSGGIIYISCDSIFLAGNIICQGENGGDAINYSDNGSGGGGSGGTIYLLTKKALNVGNNFVSALGGFGGSTFFIGGKGGIGRIRIDSPSIIGTTNPPVGYNGTSYAYLGTSTTPIITKPVDQFWGILNFNVDTSPPGTAIDVDVLNSDGSILLESVPSGSNLNYLGLQQSINSIKLIARLHNSLGNQTPILFDWTVEWTITDIYDIPSSLPKNYSISQNYPNPFNPTTSIEYQISELSFTTIKVCDVLGKEIVTLINEEKPAGTYEVMWNAANLPSGVYFYRMQAGSYVNTKKMMVIK